jgi:drug/metabolite transporter (DMT)-like permease
MQTRDFTRSRWWMPAFALLIGVIMFVAFAIGGDVTGGAISLAIMAGAGALFLFGRRGETLRGIGGPERDERWEMIDLRAVAYTGLVLITFIIGGFLYEVARGEDGSPYTLMGAVGGLSYVLFVALLRRRS